MWGWSAAYVAVAGVAAISFLRLVTDWHPRVEQSAAVSSPYDDPPTIAWTDQPTVSVHVDPQFAEEGPESVTGRKSPSETIGPVELADLLSRARQQIEGYALTTPPGDNAFETLQRVLAAVPAQPDALQGIREIGSKYALLAAQADKRGERGLAKRYLGKGLGLVPDHPDLLAVQQRLAAEPALERRPTWSDRFWMTPNRPAGTTK